MSLHTYKKTILIIVFSSLSFFSMADDPCSRYSRPNPFAPAATGATTGYSFDFTCTGDISNGLYFRDGYMALLQNSTINISNLTQNITPGFGQSGITAINFASGYNQFDGLELSFTGNSSFSRYVSTIGNYANGISAFSNGNGYVNPNDLLVVNVTNGGYASGLTIETINAGVPLEIQTNGFGSNGIVAVSLGGSGANGSSGDPGLDAGAGGAIFVENTANILTYGNSSSGIYAESIGGTGGSGGNGSPFDSGGGGGLGGFARTVEVENYGRITTYGTDSHGMFVRSSGGRGGAGGDGGFFTGGGSGGTANFAGFVNAENAGQIRTYGNFANGILAQSIGGFGGSGGSSGGLISFAGSGARAGNGLNVSVSNLGSASSIITTGHHSNGIVAQSIGGGGGNGGSATGAVAVGGAGGTGGAGRTVFVENEGLIDTAGYSSHGILAQSIGGGGGNGGSATGFAAIGGSGSSTSAGFPVSVENRGTITTRNVDSFAIFAQSIGGGGGNGGRSSSAFLSIGGSGGAGGSASTVDITNAGNLTTFGAYNATAVLAQSIGGGGGNGGNAYGAGGFTLSVGGSGSNGGFGGQVNIRSGVGHAVDQHRVVTSGDRSHGFHAQSIGGGGGNGGFAGSLSATPGASMALSFGGSGGTGGSSGFVDILNYSKIDIFGSNSSAILAQSIGGGGGNGGAAVSAAGSTSFAASASFGGSGGDGGIGSNVRVINHGTLYTAGQRSSAIVAQSIGGGGGDGGYAVSGAAAGTASLNFAMGGSGGLGGPGNRVDLTNSGNLATAGLGSHGLLAQSVGGGGGNGGFAIGASFAGGYSLNASVGGKGGNGGQSGEVNLINSGRIEIVNSEANGILAQSVGGGGGNGGFSIGAAASGTASASLSLGGSGASGGIGRHVGVTNSNNITTRQSNSKAIVAQSIGGGGGNGGFSVNGTASSSFSGGLSIGGGGSSGGNASTVTVNNSGALLTGFENGSVANHSTAILAQSIGGGGGNGGFSGNGSFSKYSGSFSLGGSSGNGGGSDLVTVTNSAQIETYGRNSHGIHAQSIGGGGGNGGFSFAGGAGTTFEADLSLGGSGSGGGNASTAYVDNNNANIITTNDSSHGILAQSIGGGGGNGGFSVAAGFSTSKNISASIGGSGSGGGLGLVANIQSEGNITTQGKLSHALQAQSIGGGGGNGGFSLGVSGSLGHSGALSIGGSGGSGARHSSTATITSIGNLLTRASSSVGILSQSIGGGGGNGGFSLAGDISKSVAVAASIGGSGGAGGYAGSANGSSTGDIRTEADDSSAMLIQSIGGGGGNGGFSLSSSNSINGNGLSLSLGGNGTVGGSSAGATLSSNGNVETFGTSSNALVVQSIGGGGGNGGFSGAFTGTLRDGSQVGFSLGANGGSGGSAGAATATTAGTVTTNGYGSTAVLAQSIGGGGGNAGHGYNLALSSGSGGTSASLNFGGNGGTGGSANTVTVSNNASLITTARFSNAITAQSIGGGGGNGGMTINGSLLPKSTGRQIGLNFGSSGGIGGSAAGVLITNTENIFTQASDSIGVLAQSIGGGGGNGGISLGVALTGADSSSYGLTLGGSGGSGNFAGDITLNNTASILTQGNRSYGVLAQTIGGGGGNSGISGAVSLGKGGNNKGYTATLGGNGGSGGYSGNINITSAGTVLTEGINAHAIFAQAIGGGGGNSHTSFAATRTGDSSEPNRNTAFAIALGGRGGNGNHAGNVSVTNNGLIQTTRQGSYGIYAQAIGGGGGSGGDVNAFTIMAETEEDSKDNTQNKSRTLSIGGDAGVSGNGGSITINNNDNIVTQGADSHAIFAQSIGGGGGNGGGAAHAKPKVAELVELPVSPSFPTIPGFNFNYSPQPETSENSNPQLGLDTKDLSVVVGGNGGASGSGSSVIINNTGIIQTTGDGAFGILAQSIGGGGGIGGLAESGETGTIGVGGAGGASGNGGLVDITHTGDISTTGIAAHAIFLQSIGGGGGLAGNIDRGITEDGTTGLALGRSGGAGGDGGNINVTTIGNIVTRGNAAFGIFAQSIGGGGGVAGSIGTGPGFAGSTGATGVGGDIVINHTGDITTFGENAHGVFAQSLDGAGTPSGSINIVYNGNITANGSGSDAIIAIAKDACTVNCDMNVTIGANNKIIGGANAAGVRFTDGKDNTLNNGATIQSISGVSGNAILATTGNDIINNNNTLIGNIDLGSGLNSLNNAVNARVVSHNIINLGGNTASQVFTNNGVVSPGDSNRLQTTIVTGNFSQASTGTLIVDIDNSNFTTDKLSVSGSADVKGKVVLNALNNGQVVSGKRQSTLVEAGVNLTSDTPVLEFAQSSVIEYDVINNAGKITLETNVDFVPNASVSNKNVTSIGNYFNALTSSPNSSSGTQKGSEFDRIVTNLTSTTSDKELATFLNQLTPESQAQMLGQAVRSQGVFNQRLRSCHQRAGANRFVAEGECSWNAIDFREVNRNETSESSGYDSEVFSLAAGTQHKIKKNFFLGAGFSFESGSSDSKSGAYDQSFNGAQLGIIAKKQEGAYLFTGTLAGGIAWNDSSRQVSNGTNTLLAESDFNTSFISLEVDAARTFEFNNFFLRPTLGMNFLNTYTSSFTEDGAGLLNIQADSSSDFAMHLRAGFDTGYEFKFGSTCGDDCVLFRPYLRASYISFLTDENTEIEARFQGAASSDSFIVTSPVFEDYIDLNIGFEILTKKSSVFKIEYGQQKGSDFTQSNILLKAGWPF